MNKKQKLKICILIFALVATLILIGIKISSEISKNMDIANGNYYTTTKLVDAEFLGKYSYNSRGINHRKGITHDEFKIIESDEIIKIPCGINTGHTGERFVTLAIIDYYSKDTNKHIFQKIEVYEVKNYVDNGNVSKDI